MKKFVVHVFPLADPSTPPQGDCDETTSGPGTVKVEAVLSDHDAERILSLIVTCRVDSSENQFLTRLLEQELALAGPQANDLWQRIVSGVERKLISQVFTECAGVKTRAAARLGIDRNTLHKKLRQYDLLGKESELTENGHPDPSS